jgi:hypothetical protein
MEGMVGTMLAGTTKVATQAVSEWVDECKRIMNLPGNRGLSDWEFLAVPDVDQTAVDIETGARLYGLLIGQLSADASPDMVVVTDDADGTLTVAHTDTIVTATLQYTVPAAATDGTEEFWPVSFPAGVSFATHMCIGADGVDGTDPATDDIRAWVLYRTVA